MLDNVTVYSYSWSFVISTGPDIVLVTLLDTTLFTRWSQKLKDFVDVENNLSTFEMRLKSSIKDMLERPEESLLSSEERMRNTIRRERKDKERRNTWTKQKAKAAWDRADHYDQVPWSKLSIPSPDTWDSLPDESDL